MVVGGVMGNELALPYVPIDPHIVSHPKTRKFLRLLGRANDPIAHMHLVAFLLAVGRHHVDGRLGHVDHDDIADMGLWQDDAGKFAAALVDSGWLQFGDGGYVVVGWEEYGGQVYAKRVEFREKQALNGKRGGRPAKTQNNPTITQNNPEKPNLVLTKPKQAEVEVEVEPKGETDLVLLGGDAVERTVTAGALNKQLETAWHWSISPKWWPGYGKLEPFSPAELRAASLDVYRTCSEDGGKPNPGLLLRKLEDGRKPARASPSAPRALTRTVSKQDQSFEEALRGVEAFNATRK